MTSVVRKFTIADTKSWDQLENQRIFGGGVIDESYGYRMSAMYWQLGRGERAPVPAPYDEVWIVNRGQISILAPGGEVVTASAGELLLVPTATPGTAEADDDTELLTLAHPPSWEIDERAWEAVQAETARDVVARKLSSDDVERWQSSGDPPALVAEQVLSTDATELGIRFARMHGGATLRIGDDDDRDIVVAATKGTHMLGAAEAEMPLAAGEFAYVPVEDQAVVNAHGEGEIVLVRHPA